MRIPDRPALDSPSEGMLTWGALADRIDLLVAGFRERGRQPGDRIGIGVYRGAVGIQLYLAAQAAGLEPVLLGIGLDRDLEKVLRGAAIRELFTGPELATAGRAALEAGIRYEPVDGTGVLELLSAPGADRSRNWAQRADGQVSAIQYSTGTTGLPKGMVRTVGSDYFDAVNRNLCMRTRQDERWICASPANINVAIGALRCMILMGGCIVPLDAVEPEDIESASRAGVSILPLQAPGWRRLLTSGVADLLPARGLRVAVSTGQRTPGPVLAGLRRLMAGHGEVVNSYGLTETSTIAVNTSSMSSYETTFVAGRPAPLCTVEVAPWPDAIADTGGRGEIRTRGPAVTPGYLGTLGTTSGEGIPEAPGRPDLYGGPDPDGWFRTGDVGGWDEAGRLCVFGRWKDAFVVAGRYVFPYELETVVGDLPGVDEVVVVADGTRLAVVVQPAEGAGVDLDAIDAALAPRHDGAYLVLTIEAMPRNASSKINRTALTALVSSSDADLTPLVRPDTTTPAR